jgi:hypothetical protein
MSRSSPRARRALTLALAALIGVIAGRASAPSPLLSAGMQEGDTLRAAPAEAPESVTYAEMRDVDFRVGDGVSLRIHHLFGAMTGRGGVVDFDDKTSFTTWIDSADVGLTGADLSNLLNRHVFAYKGAPLKNLELSMQGNRLRQRGVLRKGVNIPFDITAEVSVTPEGLIRLHPTRTRILGVNGESLMKALGLNLQKLIDLSKAKGVTVRKNDLFIDPMRVLPPPVIHARVVAVRVEGDELRQELRLSPETPAAVVATARRRPAPPSTASRYMFFRGGTLHFGRKMLMTDAEMQVVDEDPSDPFDFDIEHYQRQLIAGYSRTLPSMGLEVHMPDAREERQLAVTH